MVGPVAGNMFEHVIVQDGGKRVVAELCQPLWQHQAHRFCMGIPLGSGIRGDVTLPEPRRQYTVQTFFRRQVQHPAARRDNREQPPFVDVERDAVAGFGAAAAAQFRLFAAPVLELPVAADVALHIRFPAIEPYIAASGAGDTPA